jgi:4-amino-4-deoxy-L-arabinose transferase-like glycosyltransferase
VGGAVILFARRGRGDAGSGLPATDASRDHDARPLIAGAGALLLLVGLTAVAAPPNTWDAMTYHMARVAHWIQNGNVSFYPTAVVRQLDLAPWSEYAIAHLTLLAGSDRMANLVQWFALLGSAVAASLLARELGAGSRGQAGAAVVTTTIPMAILQGSSAQNDLSAGFWLLVFAAFVLRLRKEPERLALALGGGASLGLALLTKGTSYLFAVPFALWLAVALARRLGARAGRPLLLAGAAALALNLGHFARNASLFGTALGPPHGVLNEAPSAPALVSNAVRNLAIHLASPSARANRIVEGGVARLHRLIGADPSDPRTTWRGAVFHLPPIAPGAQPGDAEEALYAMLHEDSAGNPLHLLLVLLAAAAIALSRRGRRSGSGRVPYLGATVAAFLLFSAALKWQPWSSRLELPLFLLSAPLVAAALLDGARWPGPTAAVLLLAAAPWAVANATRPLAGPGNVFATPRLEQYFANRPGLFSPCVAAARAVAETHCDRVGLEIGPDDGEYLFWASLRASRRDAVRIEHLAVGNRSARLGQRPPFAGFVPCAVISTQAQERPPPEGAREVRYEWAGGRLTVRLER